MLKCEKEEVCTKKTSKNVWMRSSQRCFLDFVLSKEHVGNTILDPVFVVTVGADHDTLLQMCLL